MAAKLSLSHHIKLEFVCIWSCIGNPDRVDNYQLSIHQSSHSKPSEEFENGVESCSRQRSELKCTDYQSDRRAATLSLDQLILKPIVLKCPIAPYRLNN